MKNSEVTNLSEGIYSFTSNVYLVGGKSPTIIDAGNDEKILDGLRKATDRLDKVLITHEHPDHIGLVQNIKDEFDATVYAWEKEEDWVDEELSDGQEVEAGNSILKAIHTPGHFPRHIVYFGDGALFSGDLIFPGGSFGRTDLPGGDKKQLVASIKKIFEEYGGEIEELYPGHMSPILENAREHVEKSLEMVESF